MSVASMPATATTTTTGPPATRADGSVQTQGFEVIEWMEACLVHTEGEWRGKPFRLLPWQKRVLLELFTLVSDEEWTPIDGEVPTFRRGLRRKYRHAFICVAKKNGKTELASAIALYLLVGDGEPSPKGVFVAGSLAQAGLSFRGAQTMCLESPILSQLIPRRSVGDLVIEVPSIPGSRLERVAAEAGTNDGPSLHFGVLDEVHEYQGRQGRRIHGVITNAGAARRNPLFVSISTVGADLDDEEQVWTELFKRGKASQEDPTQDPTFYFYHVAAEHGADWQDRDVWEAANPSANATVTWSFYQGEWAKGERWCRRYYLNDPPGGADEPWMDPDAWDACADTLDLVGSEPTYAVVRVSHDHQSLAIAYAQRRGDRVVLRERVFDVTDEAEPNVAIDLGPVEDYLVDLASRYRGRVLMPKKWNPRGRERLVPTPGPEVAYHGSFFERSAQTLKERGLVLVDIPNSQERTVPAAETLMELVRSRKLSHDGDAELASHINHVEAKPVAKGWAIAPASSVYRRIEGGLAAMHAVHRAMTAPRPQSRRVRGL